MIADNIIMDIFISQILLSLLGSLRRSNQLVQWKKEFTLSYYSLVQICSVPKGLH
jgi:hypothetical protein